MDSDGGHAVAGWIWNANVRPFLVLLAHYAGCDFDGTDWQAVESGLEAGDDEYPDRWYSYPLVGSEHHVEVYLAQAVGGDEVSVRVTGISDGELLVRADTLIAAFAAGSVA
ncbi:hypothetical protein ACFRCG_17710 [Embleya sp. NPDC056575]|uniref:hypothetical protein n=1 Tax=unclassified Embleya TaxID=2699296 RepID=UPI00369D679E